MRRGCTKPDTPYRGGLFSITADSGALGIGRRFRLFLEDDSAPLCQEQTPQSAEVVQNPAASGDMKMEFGEVVGNQQERFFPAVGALAIRQRYFGFHVAAGLIQRFGQQRDILMGAFDMVKRRFGLITHGHALSPPNPPGSPIELIRPPILA